MSVRKDEAETYVEMSGREVVAYDNHTYQPDENQGTESRVSEADVNNNAAHQSNSFLSSLHHTYTAITSAAAGHSTLIHRAIRGALLAAYIGFFIAASVYYYKHGRDRVPIDWCGGVGFLIILTVLALLGFTYFTVKKRFGKRIDEVCCAPLAKSIHVVFQIRWFRWLVVLGLVAAVVVFLVFDTWDDRRRLQSGGGVIALILFGIIFSKAPLKINWRIIIWGLGLQFVFALIILRWEVGHAIFECLGDKVSLFLSYADVGSGFVYGYLASGIPFDPAGNSTYKDLILPPIFFFKNLSIIYFFAFFVQILFYYGIMQSVVIRLGWLLGVTVGTTPCESMNASANIFLGMTEAPLLIKPYIKDMTMSELHAVMTGGFATIAGTVLAAYISFGADPAHLLTASVISAPAALAFAKLFYPETETSRTAGENDIQIEKSDEVNALDAATRGAGNAIMLILNIGANLIAFLAFLKFINEVLAWLIILLGYYDEELLEEPLVYFVSKVLIPLAWLMGIPAEECSLVGKLVGLKVLLNEFLAYKNMQDMDNKGMLSTRSHLISIYALCGFANFSAIGIQLGSIGSMAPQRLSDLSKLGLRAMIAGNFACFSTACIAGMLLP